MGYRSLVWLLPALLIATSDLSAIYLPRETKQVPVDRLVENLERQAAADPKNVQTIVNLARLHAMAYALKIDEFPASPLASDKSDVPFFSPGSGQTPNDVRPSPSPEQTERAARHLKAAIRQYAAALTLAPDNLTARLGHGWVLQQAGDNAGAIDEYRRVVLSAWPTEMKTKMLMPSQRFYTQEAIGYLIPLLDPTRDAAEVRDLLDKQNTLKSRPRAITPIVVPLTDDTSARALLDPLARVRFDADGSALDREWTWITPAAGWLVYDADGRGAITSALQLFGNVSFWLFWTNGYEAMQALDDNRDGELSGAELRHLAIWHDRNSDGVSDSGEVASLASHGIVALSCDHVSDDDAHVAARSPAGATFSDGRTRPTYDVILRESASTRTIP